MAARPLVSIVTPSYQQARFLETAIQSVLGQSYPYIEYILIDGGSSDGSVALIQRHADELAYWVSEPDEGQADAINKGFARAGGEYMAWLNADDVLHPQAVAEAVAYLEAHPEAGMVYGDAEYIDEAGHVLGRFPAAQTDYHRLLRGYVHIPQQAAFWRASLWERVGGQLDPNFYFAMDYDLWVRLAKVSELHYLPRPWAQFRLHSASKTVQADILCWPEMLRVHRREGGRWFSFMTFKHYLRRLLAPWLLWRRRRLMARGKE